MSMRPGQFSWRQVFARWLGDRRGGIAVKFALLTPFLAVSSVCGIELYKLSTDRAALQAAADAASLMGAAELAMSPPDAVIERAKAFAASQLGSVASLYEMTYSAVVTADPAVLSVEIAAHRQSFFGNLVPPGGFFIRASSAAAAMNASPLCVLTHGVGKADHGKKGSPPPKGDNGAGILMQDDADVSAPSCMVQSNDDLTVENRARLRAAVSRAGGLVRGNISPAGESSAPLIADPFVSYNIDIPTSCPKGKAPKLKVDGSETLAPGIHCGGIELEQTAVLTLAPGEHYFIGDLKIKDESQLTGRDVVLIFDKDSKFEFKGHSRVSLEGRKSGALAGFVIVTTRGNTRDFQIDSSRVETLLGTLYVPEAQLVVTGSDRVAAQSDWTVIIAQQLLLRGSPTLVVNSNYATSNVPVPVGVGSNTGVRLVR